jgi:DNA-directed RNA polymerase subunit K/omega
MAAIKEQIKNLAEEEDVVTEEEEDEDENLAAVSEEEEEEESGAEEEEESGAEEEEEEEEEESAVEEEAEESAEEEEETATKNKKRGLNKGKRGEKSKKISHIAGIEKLESSMGKKTMTHYDSDDDDDEEEEDAVNYLQKFDTKMRENFILDHHPEARTHNYEEVKALSRVSRDGRGIIIDQLHKTIPFLTKYEMTRVIGQRAKQLDQGAKSFVKVPLNVIDGYQIALLELEQKKMPFIIKRPYPNGGVEYWNVSDLEIL